MGFEKLFDPKHAGISIFSKSRGENNQSWFALSVKASSELIWNFVVAKPRICWSSFRHAGRISYPTQWRTRKVSVDWKTTTSAVRTRSISATHHRTRQIIIRQSTLPQTIFTLQHLRDTPWNNRLPFSVPFSFLTEKPPISIYRCFAHTRTHVHARELK